MQEVGGLRVRIFYGCVTAPTHLSTRVVVFKFLFMILLGGEWGLMDSKMCNCGVGAMRVLLYN